MSTVENNDTEQEEYYYEHSASLRVYAEKSDQDFIESQTGLIATSKGIKGEPRPNSSRPWSLNLWILDSPLPRTAGLTEHLTWLWTTLAPHKELLVSMQKKGVKMDLFCGYQSNCDHAGVDIEAEALRISTELNLRFSLSIIVC